MFLGAPGSPSPYVHLCPSRETDASLSAHVCVGSMKRLRTATAGTGIVGSVLGSDAKVLTAPRELGKETEVVRNTVVFACALTAAVVVGLRPSVGQEPRGQRAPVTGTEAETGVWRSLFDGESLQGWSPFTGKVNEEVARDATPHEDGVFTVDSVTIRKANRPSNSSLSIAAGAGST